MSNKKSPAFSQAIIEEANTAFVVINSDLRLIYANPASELLLSQSTQRLYQQTLQQLANYYHFNPLYIENVFRKKNSFTEGEATLIIDEHPILDEEELRLRALASPAATHLPEGNADECLNRWWTLASRTIEPEVTRLY